MDIISFAIFAIILASTIWVYFDCVSNKIGYIADSKGFINMSAGALAACVLLLWLFALPIYIIKRKDLIEKAQESPSKNNKLWIFIIVATIFSCVTAFQVFENKMPACESKEVVDLLDKLLNGNAQLKLLNIKLGKVQNAAEQSSDIKVRNCRGFLEKPSGGQMPINYTVTWHDKVKNLIYVETTGVNGEDLLNSLIIQAVATLASQSSASEMLPAKTSQAIDLSKPTNDVVVNVKESVGSESLKSAQFSDSNLSCVNGKTLFSCTTKNNKVLLLCDRNETIEYTFGKSKKTPDLSLNIIRGAVTTYQYNGVGRYENYSIEIPNKNVIYSVFWSLDKSSENKAIEAGVNVLQAGKNISTVQCASNITNKMIGVNLSKSE